MTNEKLAETAMRAATDAVLRCMASVRLEERKRIIAIIDTLKIPPAGLDRFAGAELAAFNMGRLQQSIIQAIEKGK